MSYEQKWFGVGLDGTLAVDAGPHGPEQIGEPIIPMVDLVKKWLKEGREVRIFTERVYPLDPVRPNDRVPMYYDQRRQQAYAAAQAIRSWCARNLGRVLTITCVKDHLMEQLYDCGAVQVMRNTGELVTQPKSKAETVGR